MKHLYGKNRPAQAGIPVAETGIPARRDGTKNVPPPYKQYAIKTIETYTCRDPGHRPVPVNVPSRLSYKQALRLFPGGSFGRKHSFVRYLKIPNDKNIKSCDQNDEKIWSHDLTKIKF